MFKSTDGDMTWSEINIGLKDLAGTGSIVTAIVIDRDNPNILYAATSGSGVFKSGDGGFGAIPTPGVRLQ